ncbi:hypothetical protein I5T81_05995 [Stenotrophomonas maltophilia]|nr:hypothetical protein [Stenotrophomonas maltophilia]MBN5104091.1 hypothetical protein [Stenotrophomonas maltophilia]
MTDTNDQPSGTANVLHQMKAYRALSEEYGAEGANLLGSKSLERNGVKVPPEGVGHWAQINSAAEQGRMDLESEGAVAACKVNALVGAVFASTVPGSSRAEQISDELDEAVEEEEEEDFEDEDEDEDERPDFGYEDEEDNDEAALDHIHKINENAGD